MTNDRYLFRGKTTNDEKWHFGSLIIYGEVGESHAIYDNNTDDYGGLEVDPETVGLCSSYKDKNEERMFAGDIFETSRGHKYYIAFENGSFQCYHLKLKDWAEQPLRWGLLSRLFELGEAFTPTVIGNITDNPEMLL